MRGLPLQAQKGEDARGDDNTAGDAVHPSKLIEVEPFVENAEDAYQEQPP